MRSLMLSAWPALLVATSMPAVALEMRDLPPALAVPGGKILATVAAVGTQNYECVRVPKGQLAWSFREPAATFAMDGKPAGRHFAGPTWEFTDGSRLTARVVDKAAGKTANDLPWLKLAVVDRAKKGPASGTKWVLRIETEGGALAGQCPTEKERRAEPYKATYVFLK